MFRTNRTFLMMAALVAVLGLIPAVASAGEASASEPKAHGKLVVVLTTGLEDLQTVNMAIRHAGAAKKSGYLEDVVLLVYGRGVQVFAKEITAKPPQIGKTIQEAKEAGVHIMICAEALKKFNIPQDQLEPGVEEVVPNAIIKLSELVSQGYQVLKY